MINLEEALEDFVSYLEGLRNSENTVKSYRADLKSFINYSKTKKGTALLEESDFRRLSFAYLDSLRYYGDKKDEYSISSLNRKRTSMRKFISFLNKREYIETDFSHQIELLRGNKNAKIDVLDVNEITAVTDYLDSQLIKAKDSLKKYRALRNRFILITFLYTGMRVSELVALKWSDIDFSNNVIHIENGKGRKARTIPINPILKEEINSYKTELEEIFTGNPNLFKGYIFFRDERNYKIPITTKTVRKVIKNMMNKAHIEYKHIPPHNLRHTFASHSIKGKMSITTLSDILGHAKPSITLDIYSHIINEEQKQTEMGKLNYTS